MGRLIFDISDGEREKLEAHRVRLGCRSLADALRRLIGGEPGDAVLSPSPAPIRPLSSGVVNIVVSPKRQRVKVAPAKERMTMADVRPPPAYGARLEKGKAK